MNGSALATDLQIVTHIEHYTDRLFSFRITRPHSLRFRSGEFVMIGLPDENSRPIMRAYSIASPAWDDELEFYSIKVSDGPLTSRLQHIKTGDAIILKPKSVGTLVLDALSSARRLFLVATGTGIAPFASLIRDPETYDKYDTVIVTHTCRTSEELAYGAEVVNSLKNDPLVGEFADKLSYLPTTTRTQSQHNGRITHWIKEDRLTSHFGIAPINAETDRFMICGSMALNKDIRAILLDRGFTEGSNAAPADFTVEKAFVG
jgi:ferredoxin/flavodoxin---NADP+ reductase